MRLSDFAPSRPGKLVRPAPDYWAFVPAPLAPKLIVGGDLVARLSRAERALGYLAGVEGAVRNGHVLQGAFVRREALHSSRLEGASTSLTELFLVEERAGGLRTEDADFALNQVEAFESAQALGRKVDADRRFLAGIHRRIAELDDPPPPGEFRARQTWIGPPGCPRSEAVFVPPPVNEMHTSLQALEQYVRQPDRLPHLIRLALIHYQLHVIHPFVLRNGAVNRLLLSLLLADGPNAPEVPIGISAHFAGRREEYELRLRAVSLRGEWEGWIRFFLDGVTREAEHSACRVAGLLALHEEWRRRLQCSHERQPLFRIVDSLFQRPVISVSRVERQFGCSSAGARAALARLVKMGILSEMPGRHTDAIYLADDVVDTVDGDVPAVAPVVRTLGASIPASAPIAVPAIARRVAAGEDLPPEDPTDAGVWERPLVDEESRREIIRLLSEIETASLAA
jgi:Fic family protein